LPFGVNARPAGAVRVCRKPASQAR
jgi:hypothetical protein